MRTVKREPIASMLIESMRDIGYDLETALSDIIDNSISAGATRIDLHATVEANRPMIAVVDDGCGMTEDELLEAMRPGSKSPREARAITDLGRFGLGLKTASFSQCRRLTVISRKNGQTSAAIWDLDHVATVDQWEVQLPDAPENLPWAERLGKAGTVVLWEKMDRFQPDHLEGDVWGHFNETLAKAENHLSLVFHRFMEKSGRRKRVVMTLNERQLQPFDPFHETHPATQTQPAENILVHGHSVTVKAFTLPHHQKVTQQEWAHFEGPEGYVRSQGFYVYRAERLIIHGTWFGLARQREITKLARVRIDMPTELDAEWQIDVRKATARPPRVVMNRLRRLVEEIGATSARPYTERGRRLTQNSRVPVWDRVQDKNEIFYRVNLEHPVVSDYLSQLPAHLKPGLGKVLNIVSAALPTDSLFADMGSNPNAITPVQLDDDSLRESLGTMVENLATMGVASLEIREMLRRAEPFKSTWPRCEKLLGELVDVN